RESPEGAVADLVAHFVPGARFEVLRDEARYLSAYVVPLDRADVQSIQERERGGHPLFLMIQRPYPSVDHGRRRRLAEVVADGPEHQRDLLRAREVVDPAARLVDNLKVVH